MIRTIRGIVLYMHDMVMNNIERLTACSGLGGQTCNCLILNDVKLCH